MRIVLHIDRLVLRGIDRADAAAVTSGLQHELQRRLALPGATPVIGADGDRYRVNAGSVQIARGLGAHAMGRAIAGRIVKRTKPLAGGDIAAPRPSLTRPR